MTNKEKLIQEFTCAITAVFGDNEDKEFENDITKGDIDMIAHKVKFYMDLE